MAHATIHRVWRSCKKAAAVSSANKQGHPETGPLPCELSVFLSSGPLAGDGFHGAKSASRKRVKSPILLFAESLLPDLFERVFEATALGRAHMNEAESLRRRYATVCRAHELDSASNGSGRSPYREVGNGSLRYRLS